MSTSIKRLYQNDKAFVPVTLQEAVVVNTSNIPTLSSLGITTLDKVLRTTLGLMSNSSTNIESLQSTVDTINTALENKQDKLTAGNGITITEDGTISVSTASFELYKIVTELPEEDQQENVIYILKSSEATGNLYSEYIWVNGAWEQFGTIAADIDLSGYVTTTTYQAGIAEVNTSISTLQSQVNSINSNMLTATDVTTSEDKGSATVVVDYDIPADLYDSAIGTEDSDNIESVQ